MQILIVFACQNKYSYEEYGLHRQLLEGDYSKSDIEITKRDYKSNFQNKRLSKLGIVHLDVSKDGVVTVIENLQGQNELLVRKEINPAAVAAKAARKAQVKAKVSEHVIAPTATTEEWSTAFPSLTA